jgi:hypothetical protein
MGEFMIKYKTLTTSLASQFQGKKTNMRKKFLWTLLAMFVSESAIAAPYDDEFGKQAPNSVRRVSDQYEDTFTKMRNGLKAYRVTVLIPETTCCCFSTGRMVEENNFVAWTSRNYTLQKCKTFSFDENWKTIQYKNYQQNLDNIKKEILLAVNANVKNPVNYEGDLKLSFHYTAWSDGEIRMDGTVEGAVMQLVNSLGGWKN